MRNRVKGAWRALRGRRVFALASVGGIAALLLGSLGASTAVAHGMVSSAEIVDGTIERRDLHPQHVQGDIDQVWWSELFGRTKGDLNQVYSSEIVDRQVAEQDLSQGVRDRLGAQTSSVNGQLDADVNYGADTAGNTEIESIEATAGSLVSASATLVSGEGEHTVCFLDGPDGTHLAESFTPGTGYVTLVGVAASDGAVSLVCHVSNGEGRATDISMATAS